MCVKKGVTRYLHLQQLTGGILRQGLGGSGCGRPAILAATASSFCTAQRQPCLFCWEIVHEESACRTRHVPIAARPYAGVPRVSNLFAASLALSIIIAEQSMLQSSCSLPARLHTEQEPKSVALHDTEDQLLSRELLLKRFAA